MQELEDEVEAIDAIFPGSTKVEAEGILSLSIPNHEDLTIQLAVPQKYPDEKPSLVQVVIHSSKYLDASYLEKNVSEILDSVYVPGDVVLFELIGELQQFLDHLDENHHEEMKKAAALKELDLEMRALELKEAAKAVPNNTAKVGQDESRNQTTSLTSNRQSLKNSSPAPEDYTAGWIKSDPVVDRGSTFIAYAREVHSVEEAKDLLASLLCDRKIARSAHNMNTWRIKGDNGVSYQDCDDDGETAAGLRMLHLLTVCLNFTISLLHDFTNFRLWMFGT